jgi:hypothetical protein
MTMRHILPLEHKFRLLLFAHAQLSWPEIHAGRQCFIYTKQNRLRRGGGR